MSWLITGETGRRASHAIACEDGVWLFDPLNVPGIRDHIAELGEVTGVAVLSNYHTRDAGEFAERYDVPVSVPSWMDRVEERVDASVVRYDGELSGTGFSVRQSSPIPGWKEGVAYREHDRTLYVPDVLGSAPVFTVGDERIGVYLLARAFPPRDVFADIQPDRILFGHGTPIENGAADTLTEALSNARRRFPHALATNGWTQLRALVAALD
jgi:hypothetical protein